MRRLIYHFMFTTGFFIGLFYLFMLFFSSMNPTLFFGIPNECIFLVLSVLLVIYLVVTDKKRRNDIRNLSFGNPIVTKGLYGLNFIFVVLSVLVLLFYIVLLFQ